MTVPICRLARVMAGGLTLLVGAQFAAAQQGRTAPPSVPSAAAAPAAAQAGVLDWLQRMHAASRQRAYVGTFVVSAGGGNLSSARIWHLCEGNQQIERVEALSGPPRSTFRRNDEVLTFMPDKRLVRRETRESLDLFPGLPEAPDAAIAEHYGAQPVGRARVAGFETEVVQIVPRDDLRFGYRIWTESGSGLLVKLQTLDAQGRVIEQSAFSELQLDPPIKAQALLQMMQTPSGYRVEKARRERTTAAAEGWALSSPVAGFKPMGCYRRPIGAPDAQARSTMQWIFSDGLASVSLFIEPYDADRMSEEALFALGATYTLTRRIPGPTGPWWLSAVGEVPPRTLEAFASRLARQR